MRYNPDAANASLVPDGTWCDALIESAIEAQSKKGNEMIVADFKVYDPAGMQPTIKHWFVSDFPGMFKKLCLALGLDYDSGNISADVLKGKMVKVLVKIREDKSGQFSDKNVIAGFAKEIPGANQSTLPLPKPTTTGEADEDLPF